MLRTLSPSSDSRLLIIVLIALMAVLAGCDAQDSERIPNRPPETSVPNIPTQGWNFDNPIQVLQWSGNDPDGFIVAYRYRWTYMLPHTPEVQYRPYVYLMNFMPGRAAGKLAVIIQGDPAAAVKVYDVLRIGIDTSLVNALAAGDTILLAGVPVFASNPDAEPYPTHINPNTGTFLFESQDSINPHTFEVAAIDDQGALDPTPAVLQFTSPLVEPPAVWIRDSVRYANDTLLILDNFTDTFVGIEFTFGGSTTTQKIEYSYVVDRDMWPPESLAGKWSPFSENTSVWLKASDFFDHYALTHTISVRGRNEFGSISPDTIDFFLDTTNGRYFKYFTHITFNTNYPEFAKPGGVKRILVLNNSSSPRSPDPPMRPRRTVITQYYRDLYDSLGLPFQVDFLEIPYDTLTPAPVGAFPKIGVMGQYSLIHVFGDMHNDTSGFRMPQITPASVGKMLDYLEVGGKIFFTGWYITYPVVYPTSDAAWNFILHFQNQTEVRPPEFLGAVHQPLPEATQYPDVTLDPTKLYPSWDGGLPKMYVYQPYGFGEIIYRFNSRSDFPLWEGAPVGIRYLGLTYDVIFLGFPLYQTQKDVAVQILRKALGDLKHL